MSLVGAAGWKQTGGHLWRLTAESVPMERRPSPMSEVTVVPAARTGFFRRGPGRLRRDAGEPALDGRWWRLRPRCGKERV
ncbi:hypothetical protein DEF23_11005 [Marinitenerispora sediminis]|uniref:Uncharacterized protein n=1 Tax=Marinitenerispora sediminis TaxID=1931232 RepID=A0A368T531_9ACTN|nr:hypothetical protein DEF28_15485 [Marinitenerispora sediminis]RCV57216.1 hypothetical protein DEF23_11005 [Marinitenerispora sediminis]RCV58570.1 hypothetical protein DEF24_13035 [Marinitenerispora sediminis]